MALHGTVGHKNGQNSWIKKGVSLDQDLPQPNGPDTCIGFHEMTTSKSV